MGEWANRTQPLPLPRVSWTLQAGETQQLQALFWAAPHSVGVWFLNVWNPIKPERLGSLCNLPPLNGLAYQFFFLGRCSPRELK